MPRLHGGEKVIHICVYNDPHKTLTLPNYKKKYQLHDKALQFGDI